MIEIILPPRPTRPEPNHGATTVHRKHGRLFVSTASKGYVRYRRAVRWETETSLYQMEPKGQWYLLPDSSLWRENPVLGYGVFDKLRDALVYARLMGL